MSTTFATTQTRPWISADGALKSAAAFWFAVMVIGEIIFAASTALFYGLTALHGDWHSWSKHLSHALIAGDHTGNAALVAHLALAVLVTLSGAAQLVPHFRRHAPGVHRWNGRVFIVTAFGLSLAGLYLLISRGTTGTLVQELGAGLLGPLMMICAAMAWRTALKRDFAAHRRWALRLFLLVSSAIFIRAAITLVSFTLVGAGAFDASVIQGPVLTVVAYGQYCLPLAVLELYFWCQTRGGRTARFSMAGALVVLTLILGTGIAAASVAIFVPNIRAALDKRPSIALALAETIKTSGIDAAVQQYRMLHAARPVVMNFDEDELNGLGYDLLRAKQARDAVRIFQLNTETYPASGNTWDSLGEAYMDDGDKPDAIANYRRSLAINPANRNAVVMLNKLGVR